MVITLIISNAFTCCSVLYPGGCRILLLKAADLFLFLLPLCINVVAQYSLITNSFLVDASFDIDDDNANGLAQAL